MIENGSGNVTPNNFAEVVADIRPGLVAFAGRLGLGVDRDDYVQTTLGALWERSINTELDPLKMGGNIGRYARTILRRQTIDAFRKQSIRFTTAPYEETDYPAVAPSPEDITASNELWNLAAKVLDHPDKITVLRMHINGSTIAEIAKELDIPEGTAKTRVHYVKKALRDAANKGKFEGYAA
jgi:RNA polymerase sigma-70 factor (ECF subfamily)